jgi:hypothetical protein
MGSLLRKLATLFALGAIGALSLQACGGRSSDTFPDSTTGTGAGASFGATGGSNACLPLKTECVHAADCCSGICFEDPPPRGPSDLMSKICIDCIRAGEPCQQGRDSSCCSDICYQNNRCGCSVGRSPCGADSDCCSSFCYVERSICLKVRCDPRLYPDADPEQCWLDPLYPPERP